MGAPGLDAVLQIGPHGGRGGHIPLPPGHPSFDEAQDTVGLPGYKSTLLAHVQLFGHQEPQVFLGRAALKDFFS